jgi:hypothetical protein
VWCCPWGECGAACVGSVVLPVRRVWCCLWGECGAACDGSVVLPVRGVWCYLWGECGAACEGSVVLPECGAACEGSVVLPVMRMWCCLWGKCGARECGAAREVSVVLPVWGVWCCLCGECGSACEGVPLTCCQEAYLVIWIQSISRSFGGQEAFPLTCPEFSLTKHFRSPEKLVTASKCQFSKNNNGRGPRMACCGASITEIWQLYVQSSTFTLVLVKHLPNTFTVVSWTSQLATKYLCMINPPPHWVQQMMSLWAQWLGYYSLLMLLLSWKVKGLHQDVGAPVTAPSGAILQAWAWS